MIWRNQHKHGIQMLVQLDLEFAGDELSMKESISLFMTQLQYLQDKGMCKLHNVHHFAEAATELEHQGHRSKNEELLKRL